MIEKLKNEIKLAMRTTNRTRLTTLRCLLSEVQKIAINDRRKDITESDLIDAVQRGIKQRNNSIIQFKEGNRDDLVMKEQVELCIYNEFQLKQMSDEDIINIVDKVINEIGATSKKDMSHVMSSLKKQVVKGTVDIKKLSHMVISKLN